MARIYDEIRILKRELQDILERIKYMCERYIDPDEVIFCRDRLRDIFLRIVQLHDLIIEICRQNVNDEIASGMAELCSEYEVAVNQVETMVCLIRQYIESADSEMQSPLKSGSHNHAFYNEPAQSAPIIVPGGMLAPGPIKSVSEPKELSISNVEFSAVAPKTFIKGEYSMVGIIMYEDAFRSIVDEELARADEPVKETKFGRLKIADSSAIRVTLSSPDFSIPDNTDTQVWQGEYLKFFFAVDVPDDFSKSKAYFVASVYVDDVLATRLKFIADCRADARQKLEPSRNDIMSAFVSYASVDRNRVAAVIQGMKKARPDMDIFFDVESLRSGDDWENVLWSEIDSRDILYLFWSRSARDSKWVDAEWHYAMEHKGLDCMEPVPIEPPGVCPPPKELMKKHFNDRLLYVISRDD